MSLSSSPAAQLSHTEPRRLVAAATATLALLLATAMHVAQHPPTTPDQVVGYVLLVIGYLLLPGLGVMLMHRDRELQHTRSLLQQQHDQAVISATSAPSPTLTRPMTSAPDTTSTTSHVAPTEDPLPTAATDSAPSEPQPCTRLSKRDPHASTDWRDVRCAAQGGLFFSRAAPDARAVARDVDAAAPITTACRPDGHCAVCLADVEVGEQVRRLGCSHEFHPACAELWLVTGRRNSCPLCAAQVCPGRDAAMLSCR